MGSKNGGRGKKGDKNTKFKNNNVDQMECVSVMLLMLLHNQLSEKKICVEGPMCSF